MTRIAYLRLGVGLAASILSYQYGHINEQRSVRLAWSAGYAASYYATYPKSMEIQAACNPLAEALNSDGKWNYARCARTMIALKQWP